MRPEGTGGAIEAQIPAKTGARWTEWREFWAVQRWLASRGHWTLRETKSVFLLSVRPHPPCGMALRIRYSFPTFHKDSIADNRLNRLAQRLLGYLVCCAWRHIDIRCLHRDDEPVPAIGIHLHGVRRLGYSGRLFAVIPQMRSNEDEQQNQGHHHVVVETAPR